MSYTTDIREKYGMHISIENIRLVWACLTACPEAPLKEISQVTGISRSGVTACRRFLRDAGYVTYTDREQGTCTEILLPFYVSTTTTTTTTRQGRRMQQGLRRLRALRTLAALRAQQVQFDRHRVYLEEGALS